MICQPILYVICIAIIQGCDILALWRKNMSQSETISLRMSPAQRETIDLAAKSCGKSRSGFIIESAVSNAQDLLLDRTRLVLDGERWDAFIRALDEPVDASIMMRTLETPPPWKEG